MLGWGAGISGRVEAATPVTANSTSVQLTASATLNTKGAWTSLGVTPASTWGRLGLVPMPENNPADFLLDIGQSSDGTNFSVLVQDLHVPNFAAFLYTVGVAPVLPVRVQRGVAVYGRISASAASETLDVSVRGGPGILGGPGFSRCVPLFTPASSRGIAIDPGATANTVSAWVQMSTGVSQRIGAVLLVVGTNAVTTRAAVMSWLVDIGVGASGSQQVLISGLPFSVATGAVALLPCMFGPLACDIPASTAWWVRARCSASTASTRTFDASLYGLVV